MPSEFDIAMRYLGKPFKAGGRGPDAFDCYGLCIDVYKTLLGRDVAAQFEAFNSVDGQPSVWRKIAIPTPFCVVQMDARGIGSHSGIYLSANRGGVLHAHGSGVVFTPIIELPNVGLDIISFYRHIEL